MSFHDRSDTRTPATYRTTRPATYRTTTPAAMAAGRRIHGTVGPCGGPPRVVPPRPAAPRPAARGSAGDIVDGSNPRAAVTAELPADRQATPRPTAGARYVDSNCLIGVGDPHRPDLIRARGVARGGHPRLMLATLRRLWTTLGRDSTRLVARLLAHDWLCLDPATPATTPPASAAGRRVIAGVGITHAATEFADAAVARDEPITVVPLAYLDTLDTAWLYLLYPAADSITVHTGDGNLVTRHFLNP